MMALTQLRDERIYAHRYLSRFIAARFLRPGLERADLEQVALIGLIKAVDRYNPSIGKPFRSFARQHIIGELMHYVRDHESIVRFPRALQRLHRREQQAHFQLRGELGREPSSREIQTALGCRFDELHTLYAARHHCTRAEQQAEYCYPALAANVAEQALLWTSLHSLDQDEQYLLLGVYGLRLTQTEVGNRLGYTQRSASRLHKRALQKLSHVLVER